MIEREYCRNLNNVSIYSESMFSHVIFFVRLYSLASHLPTRHLEASVIEVSHYRTQGNGLRDMRLEFSLYI